MEVSTAVPLATIGGSEQQPECPSPDWPPNIDPEHDVVFMRKALGAAQQAIIEKEVPVGCVFVKDREVVAEGWNQTNKTCNVWLRIHWSDILI